MIRRRPRRPRVPVRDSPGDPRIGPRPATACSLQSRSAMPGTATTSTVRAGLRGDLPQSTTGARYFSGWWFTSSWNAASITESRCVPTANDRAASFCARCCSCLRRWMMVLRRQDAVRQATWCSHGPSESRTQRDRALRTRTRKVAWKASSASCSSCTIATLTRQTIASCRSTSAAKASSTTSSASVANRSRELAVG